MISSKRDENHVFFCSTFIETHLYVFLDNTEIKFSNIYNNRPLLFVIINRFSLTLILIKDLMQR